MLVASPHPEVRELVRRALGRDLAGPPVCFIDSAERLVEEVRLAPAVVLLDTALPGFGADLLGRLGGEPHADLSSFLLLIDPGQDAAVAACHAELVDDFLLTSRDPEEVAARVKFCRSRAAARLGQHARAQAMQDQFARQTEFFSVVSHEIRTPLSAIMSSAGILKRYGRERPDSVERFAGLIQQETRRLTRLINNLLEINKIEAGKVDWRLAPTPVDELLDLARDSFAALAGERELALEVSHTAQPRVVIVDRDRIIQVLANLLSNAVKHSPDGGTVRLRASGGKDGRLRIEVEDEGPGISAGQEERIFGRFQQLEVGDERKGTGLGLTISRQIVEHHGGRVWAEPGRERGALLVVELPPKAGGEPDHGAVR